MRHITIVRNVLYGSPTNLTIKSTFHPHFGIYARLNPSSLWNDVLHFLQWMCHSKHFTRLIASLHRPVESFGRCSLPTYSLKCRIWCSLLTQFSVPCLKHYCTSSGTHKKSIKIAAGVHTATSLLVKWLWSLFVTKSAHISVLCSGGVTLNFFIVLLSSEEVLNVSASDLHTQLCLEEDALHFVHSA